ncbi:MAG: hypothetical protein HXY50_04325 [Ignavibacteriaceae bacterium]|nr:hypothetical protein [Ignavibacteriaceae bacterium]
MQIKNLLKLTLFTALVFLSGCSSSQQVTSLPNNNEIKVDGDLSDWQDLTNIKNENISFGFKNDEHALYLVMVTNDRSKIMKIMRGGLEVWLEPENSDDKIGIRFPEKPDPGEMMEQFRSQNMPNRDKQKLDEQNQQEKKELDPGMQMFLSKQKELYVLDEEGKVLKSFSIKGDSYAAAIKPYGSFLCYELKIPFGSKPYLSTGLLKDKNSKLSVEFVTGEIETEFDRMPRQEDIEEGRMPPQGPPAGGMPPGGPGMGPGGSGRNMKDRRDNVPMEYSFEILIKK